MCLVRTLAGLCLASAPALASTVTETLSFAGSPSSIGNTVYGPVFDPGLGTLTGVTMTASGSYTPHIFTTGPVLTTASTLYVDLITPGPGGGLRTLADGGETLTLGTDGYLNGPGENFSETATVTNAAALSQVYTAFGPYRSGGLLGLDVFSKPPTPGGWGGPFDDVSDYSGTLLVSFSYIPDLPMPEPASLALFGVAGALTLGLARVRPGRRSSPA